MKLIARVMSSLVICLPLAAEPTVVDSVQSPMRSDDGRMRASVSSLFWTFGRLTGGEKHEYERLSDEELSRPGDSGDRFRPMKVGVVRPLNEAISLDSTLVRQLGEFDRSSQTVGGGHLERHGDRFWSWTTAVRSVGAEALRLQFGIAGEPADATVFVYSQTGEVHGPYRAKNFDADAKLWSNSVEGDEMVVEIQFTATSAPFVISVDSIAHLVFSVSVATPEGTECLQDPSCSTVPESPNLLNVLSTASAQLNFVSGTTAYVCSGSLVNDTDDSSFVPYLLTANHCFSTAAAASSLEAVWRYRTSACGGQAPNYASLPRSRGATLLATSATSDFTFVRLGADPPGGSYFLGWDPAAITSAIRLYRIANPGGGPQAFSVSDLRTASGPTCTSGIGKSISGSSPRNTIFRVCRTDFHPCSRFWSDPRGKYTRFRWSGSLERGGGGARWRARAGERAGSSRPRPSGARTSLLPRAQLTEGAGAGPGGGGREGPGPSVALAAPAFPRCARILVMTLRSVMIATTRIVAPHAQRSGSTS